MSNSVYEAELFRLQTELVKLQEWVRATGARIVILFEGRDAAGKGGTIKRITEYLSPRTAGSPRCRRPATGRRGSGTSSATSTPAHQGRDRALRPVLVQPGRGRTGDGFLHPQEETLFLRQCPLFEQMLIDDGIMLRKYWFSVSEDEQLRRFKSRLNDPLRRWKLSPMDMESIYRWEDYSRAKDDMMVHTDTPNSPWFEVESHIKKHARLNMISHLLSTIPYEEVELEKVVIPERPQIGNYRRPPRNFSNLRAGFRRALLGDKDTG